MLDRLNKARVLAENGHLAQAWKICDECLNENPESPHAMVLASFILDKEGRPSVSYHLAKRLTQLWPTESAGWTNLGRCADAMWRTDEAEMAHKKALRFAKGDDRTGPLLNLSALYLQVGRWSEAEDYANRALAVDPDNLKAKHNLGLCQLARRDWAGWANYRASVGTPNRIAFSYTGEPLWEGERVGTLVLSGEQGLGDEINAASAFEDVQRLCDRLIVDCDPRLVNLFRRSFPGVTFHGTRNQAQLDWPEADRQIDASLPMMQAHEYTRLKDADFTGQPYLVADPDRVTMWKSLWDRKGPVIGIAWTGGIKSTGSAFRQWSLEDMLPVFKANPKAHFVCLQYRDASQEIAAFKRRHPEASIEQYPYATLTQDYDDTAALVASLDMVVSVQTSVIHLAGALGVQTLCGVAQNGQWRYGVGGDRMPWYQSVRLFRQDKMRWPMDWIARQVSETFAIKEAA